MKISTGIVVSGLHDEILVNDLGYILGQFRHRNPNLDIEKASPIVKVVMESAGDERGFELTEDENNIRLEVGDDL